MDAEDTPSILSVGSSLLAVACAVSSIPMVARVSRLGEELAGGRHYLMGRSLSWSHSLSCRADKGCSEVAMRYLSVDVSSLSVTL